MNPLCELLNRYAPEYGVPEGDEAQWSPYIECLSRFSVASIERAMEAWKRGEFDKRRPQLGTIFPTAPQLGLMAVKVTPSMDAAPSHAPYFKALMAQLKPLPDSMRPSMTPSEVARALRDGADDVDIVL